MQPGSRCRSRARGAQGARQRQAGLSYVLCPHPTQHCPQEMGVQAGSRCRGRASGRRGHCRGRLACPVSYVQILHNTAYRRWVDRLGADAGAEVQDIARADQHGCPLRLARHSQLEMGLRSASRGRHRAGGHRTLDADDGEGSRLRGRRHVQRCCRGPAACVHPATAQPYSTG